MAADRTEYTPIVWVNDVTALNQANLNHLEQGIYKNSLLSRENAILLDEIYDSFITNLNVSFDSSTDILLFSIGNENELNNKWHKVFSISIDTHKIELNNLDTNKLDKKTSSGNFIYSHNGTSQSEIPYGSEVNNGFLITDENGRLKIIDPYDLKDATNKDYVDSQDASLLNSINNTYAKKTELNSTNAEINGIKEGTITVNKSLKDSDGNTINTTYVKIANIIDSLASTSTTQPLSANQGRVLQGKIDTILNLIASNDTDLDTVQEIVTYIKNNKSLIDGVTTNKVNVSDIVDNLASQLANRPLSANQGYILKALIDALNNTKANTADVYTKEGAQLMVDNKLNSVTNMNIITNNDKSKIYSHRLVIKGEKVFLAITDITETE